MHDLIREIMNHDDVDISLTQTLVGSGQIKWLTNPDNLFRQSANQFCPENKQDSADDRDI